MGDFIKIKDKRYRSSSSIGGATATETKRFRRKVHETESTLVMDNKLTDQCEGGKRKTFMKKLKKIKIKRRKSLISTTNPEYLTMKQSPVSPQSETSTEDVPSITGVVPNIKRRLFFGSPSVQRKTDKSPSVESDDRKQFLNIPTIQITKPDNDMDDDVSKENKPRSPKPEKGYRSPTLSSQLKKRCLVGCKKLPKIPFISAARSSPSFNIGLNISQVYKNLKFNQISPRIPSTLAKGLGLCHISKQRSKSDSELNVDKGSNEVNAIRLGRREVHLPKFKKLSYHNLLDMYKEEGGIASKFLASTSRSLKVQDSYSPENISAEFQHKRKKRSTDKRELNQMKINEFMQLYLEYNDINNMIKEGNCNYELAQRREILIQEMSSKEAPLKKITQDCKIFGDLVNYDELFLSKSQDKELEESPNKHSPS